MSIFDTDLANSGLLVLAGAAALKYAADIPKKAFAWIKPKLLYSMEVDNTDERIFRWVKNWIAANGKSRYVQAIIENEGNGGVISSQERDRETPKFRLLPRGFSVIRYRRKRIFVSVSRVDIQGVFSKRETITLQVLKTNRGLFLEFLQDAYKFSEEDKGNKVKVFIQDYSNWSLATTKDYRSIDTLCLADNIGEKLVKDAKDFLSREKWYRERGIPYRRGYMLKGPPGNGKSSLIHALASALNKDISILSLSSVEKDQNLTLVLSRVPRHNILVVEDADPSNINREMNLSGDGVTFSSILNAIDGIAALEGRILILTSNHADKLDPALVRPGRIDIEFELGNANYDQACRMYKRFLNDDPFFSEEKCHQFAEEMTGKSMAYIQEKLLSKKDV